MSGVDMIGVAISTTGQQHRLGFLETCVEKWRENFDGPLFVTVDGNREEALAVQKAVGHKSVVYWLGYEDRRGVAANKNVGIELLMHLGVEHLFLSDDDSWPLSGWSLALHTHLAECGVRHSMVCWGAHRASNSVMVGEGSHKAEIGSWSWPRGSVLYVTRSVIENVGGMREEFGHGGHEHVEWSRRIFQAHLTPVMNPTPAAYLGDNAMGAKEFWHCEDMPLSKDGRVEHLSSLMARRRRITSLRRPPQAGITNELRMRQLDGNVDFVPFTCEENDRVSAILCSPLVVTVPRSQS